MSAITNDHTVDARRATTRWYGQLYSQVLIGIALGALTGYLWPDIGVALKPLGDALIKMIKMAIAPIVFLTVVHGIAGLGDMRKAGRIGVKALLYFEATTTIALIFGLIVINFVQPVSACMYRLPHSIRNSSASRNLMTSPSWRF